MSQLALADTVAEWTIFALRAAATLPADLQIVPFVSSEQAQSERLIVKCETGNKRLDGGELYDLTLTFEFITTKRSAEEANDIFAKVEAAISSNLTATARTRAGELFKEVFLFPENATTTLDHGGNVRTYTRTLPLQTDRV